jgi:hypothetical protein
MIAEGALEKEIAGRTEGKIFSFFSPGNFV